MFMPFKVCHPACVGWVIRGEGGHQIRVPKASYEQICAIARHFNGQDPEPGDLDLLFELILQVAGAAT